MAGPDLQVMVSDLAVAVQVLFAVLALLTRPVHDADMVAVCDVVAVEIVGRFHDDSDVPDPPGGVAYPENHIAWTDLRQVIQLTTGVNLVTKNAGAINTGVTAAAVGSIGVVAAHELCGLGAGYGALISIRVEIRIIPEGPGWPFHFQSVQDFQNIFFSDRFSIGEDAILRDDGL